MQVLQITKQSDSLGWEDNWVHSYPQIATVFRKKTDYSVKARWFIKYYSIKNQKVEDGFQRKKNVLALWINFKKTFDKVWKYDLVKCVRRGIYLWRCIQIYLHIRGTKPGEHSKTKGAKSYQTTDSQRQDRKYIIQMKKYSKMPIHKMIWNWKKLKLSSFVQWGKKI